MCLVLPNKTAQSTSFQVCVYATLNHIDFRKYPPSQPDTVIHDNKVEVVDEYKYLGTTIDNMLKFHIQEMSAASLLPQKTCPFNVDSTILSTFYKSCIQSVLTLSYICWFWNVSQKDKNNLQCIVEISSKVTGLKESTPTLL